MREERKRKLVEKDGGEVMYGRFTKWEKIKIERDCEMTTKIKKMSAQGGW